MKLKSRSRTSSPALPGTSSNALPRQSWLRLAVISALGLGAGTFVPTAEANCVGDPNPSIPSGSYGYISAVCEGAPGVDGDSDEKIGGDGDAVDFNLGAAFSLDVSTNLNMNLEGNVPGVVTMYTRGGTGVDEGDAGDGGSATLTNTGAVTLSGTTSAGSVQSLISVSSVGGNGDDHNDNNDSDGGDGGNGGEVSIHNSGTLTIAGSVQPYTVNGSTRTEQAMFGIRAISGGGTGGDQNGSIFGDQVGGKGGSGGTVTVSNGGAIRIGSSSSRLTGFAGGAGIHAESYGGSGGTDNGSAGDGRMVTVSNSAQIDQYWSTGTLGGDELYGIRALSKGDAGTQSNDDSNDGGRGGDGYPVMVTSSGNIVVDVDGAFTGDGAGIAAASQGGKGGKGPGKDHAGGNGGIGNVVNVGLQGAGSVITTRGDNLIGILAQSLGGEGGDGGTAGAIAGQGGGAGFGGSASGVTVNTAAQTAIQTSGHFASGVVAQSVGGGGGTGGTFVSVLGGQSGNGGNGGDADNVNVEAAGSIATAGDHAYGLLAQSIAGSGGTGGVSVSGLVSLGGDGAGGGSAGKVLVSNLGGVSTSGYSSHGLIAQSIGGGGGASGSALGALSVGGSAEGSTGSRGGDVTTNNSGNIKTLGNAAVGMVAQSIGGGGGSGGDSLGIMGVGGSGAAGGTGGSVIVHDLGNITTSGRFSPGVLAQSIGGGGGNGGDTFTASAGVSVAIGGSGSGGGDGGSVCMGNAGACDVWLSAAPASLVTHGDYSPGIVAQNIGGGGGNGGSVNNVSLLSFAALQVGGSAGGGGNAGAGGTLLDYNNLNIQTGGAQSHGILAQSIGGGGGNGGDASYVNATAGLNAAFAIGGSGGDGGDGSTTSVRLHRSRIATGMDYNTADPATYAPNDSYGILAQTIGGGGGNGGSVSAKSLVIAVPPGNPALPPMAINFQAAIGGSGGGGGHACPPGDASCVTEVGLYEGTSVTTLGDGSHAVVAQSIGGGGGNGGDSSVLSAGVGYSDSMTAQLGLALGGSAGTASNGGKVAVVLGSESEAYVNLPSEYDPTSGNLLAPDSSIVTYGDFANGLLAQSIGGGGGNGGVGSSNAYSHGGLASISLTMAIGGIGGKGGDGGEVDTQLNPTFAIHTVGSGSRGILAQSIGGGGGASQGGTMSLGAGIEGIGGKLTLGVGQTGGEGGDGGSVKALVAGAVRTEGGDADGVVLQSIGGGGGVGGSIGADASSNPILDRIGLVKSNISRLTDEDSLGYSFAVNVGGRGGEGGQGGPIDLNYVGKIATQGDWADGMVAQSIGGGGGAGGSSTTSGSAVTASVAVAIGGAGGAGGHGGDITTKFDGSHGNSVSTEGYSAYGVLLQSIGGGGGQGGDGSDMAKGTISVGGSAGGSGGTSGMGGSIRSSDTASWLAVQTSGSDSPAFAAQSIGGGGGIGGAGNSDSRTKTEGYEFALSVGGRGGTGNHGGTVDLTLGSSATTLGDRSPAFILQSIGGGGGIGGAGQAGHLLSVGLGGRGGAGGNGGSVGFTLRPGSHVRTTGAGAHGIIAQSIGGGGGIAGDTSISLGLTPGGWAVDASDVGGQGDGGSVRVSTDGTVETSGSNAFGVVAQSIGGGGGLGGIGAGGFAGSTAGASGTGRGGSVTVTQAGSLTASGTGATGIFAQSSGPNGAGTVTVNVQGQVTGGSDPEATSVWVADGYRNVINVGSGAAIVRPASGIGVRYDGRGTTEEGYTLDLYVNGTVSGNILCQNASSGTACNAYSNGGAAMKEATSYQANIYNAGRLDIGHAGSFDTLAVAGDYTQFASGVLHADADFAGLQSDQMVVHGDATLDGSLAVNAVSLMPQRELTVLDVKGNAQGMMNVIDTPLFEYSLRQEGPTYRVSVSGARLQNGVPGLEGNEEGIAEHLQNIWNAGSTPELGPLFAALNDAANNGSGTYRERLRELTPGATLAPAEQMGAGLTAFSDAMVSCQTGASTGRGTGGADGMREQDCFWGEVTRRNTDRDGSSGNPGYDFDTTTLQLGGQREIRTGWFLGGSVAYQDSSLRGESGRVRGSGDAGFAGVVLKHQSGPWTYSGALAGGYGSFRLDRTLGIAGYDARASSSPDVFSAGARLRAARHIGLSEQLYLKPYVDLDLLYTKMSGYTESGGPLSLSVDSSKQLSVGLSPMLEFGGQMKLENGGVLRPFAYAGASFRNKDGWSATARLKGAPAGVGGMDASLEGDKVVGRFGAGVQLNTPSGLDVRLQYDGQASNKTQSHAGQLKLMYRF